MTSEAPPAAPRSSPAGRRSFLRRKPTVPDVVAAVVFATAGALFAASSLAAGEGVIRQDNTGGLRDAITRRAQYDAALEAQIRELTQRVEVARVGQAQGPAINAVEAELADLYPAVGLTEVTGPGVTVQLNDAVPPDPIPADMTGDDYLVHQQDVQGVVNAMWQGGASGVTVMGQRLISTSAVRCVGNTVILQGTVYSPPFEIKAVGNPVALQIALANDPALQVFREWSALVGLGYRERTFARETLPAYTGPLDIHYAEVVSD